MRIIAGRYKGARLFTPKNNLIRPTSDRTREFLFSYLGPAVHDAVVLDLFAGTGAFGIEALSRGGAEAIFVDISPQAVQLLHRNLCKVGLEAPCFRMSARQFLKKAFEKEMIFDIIFCDPPYDYFGMKNIAGTIYQLSLLRRPTGLLIYESGKKSIPPNPPGLAVIKEKCLGDTKITIYGSHEQ